MSKTLLNAAVRYINRLRKGDLIMRDAMNRLQWSDGKPVGRKTVSYMLEAGEIAELDTDLFGDYSRGQTLGLRDQA